MQGNIYYVSNLGDDANIGTTKESPWKTLRKISSMTFNPGDHILLKSGNAWNEALILHGSGTADQPINVTAYGEGSKPKIHYGDGDVVILINEGGWCIKGLEISLSIKVFSVQGSPIVIHILLRAAVSSRSTRIRLLEISSLQTPVKGVWDGSLV